jgi:hypothetical protein
MSKHETHIIGNKNSRRYIDAVGKPLAKGDVVLYCTAQSSSLSMHFAVVYEFIDLKEPAYVGHRDGTRISSWDRAFKLKVKRLEQDELRPDRFTLCQRYDLNASKWVDQSLDEAPTNTIIRTDRVVKLEGVYLDER